ncbi:MAG TPA: hypothetical protein VLB12_18490 [Gemmatimonadales bacterium]|nr:hypothetical protein [Gemmatimonadales bacterium]
MTIHPRLSTALADRYRIDRELACRSVAEATTRLLSLKRHGLGIWSHLSDTNRVAAAAAEVQTNDSRLTTVP